jgi:hypothetical protein
VIADAPDNQSAAAVSLAVTASGAVRTKITVPHDPGGNGPGNEEERELPATRTVARNQPTSVESALGLGYYQEIHGRVRRAQQPESTKNGDVDPPREGY